MKDIALGNLIGHWRKGRSHLGQTSSYKNETFARWGYHTKRKHLLDGDMQDPQDSLKESSSEGSLI